MKIFKVLILLSTAFLIMLSSCDQDESNKIVLEENTSLTLKSLQLQYPIKSYLYEEIVRTSDYGDDQFAIRDAIQYLNNKNKDGVIIIDNDITFSNGNAISLSISNNVAIICESDFKISYIDTPYSQLSSNQYVELFKIEGNGTNDIITSINLNGKKTREIEDNIRIVGLVLKNFNAVVECSSIHNCSAASNIITTSDVIVENFNYVDCIQQGSTEDGIESAGVYGYGVVLSNVESAIVRNGQFSHVDRHSVYATVYDSKMCGTVIIENNIANQTHYTLTQQTHREFIFKNIGASRFVVRDNAFSGGAGLVLHTFHNVANNSTVEIENNTGVTYSSVIRIAYEYSNRSILPNCNTIIESKSNSVILTGENAVIADLVGVSKYTDMNSYYEQTSTNKTYAFLLNDIVTENNITWCYDNSYNVSALKMRLLPDEFCFNGEIVGFNYLIRGGIHSDLNIKVLWNKPNPTHIPIYYLPVSLATDDNINKYIRIYTDQSNYNLNSIKQICNNTYTITKHLSNIAYEDDLLGYVKCNHDMIDYEWIWEDINGYKKVGKESNKPSSINPVPLTGELYYAYNTDKYFIWNGNSWVLYE